MKILELRNTPTEIKKTLLDRLNRRLKMTK